MMRSRRTLVGVLVLSLLGTLITNAAAQTRDVDAAPIPMLKTGGHTGSISGLIFTRDGKRLISSGLDKIVRVWNAQTGILVKVLRGDVGPGPEGQVSSIALSPDETMLAVGGWFTEAGKSGFCIRLFDLANGNILALLRGHGQRALSLAFSPSGKQLLSGGADNTAIIWDLSGGGPPRVLSGHSAEIEAVAFLPDGKTAITGSRDTTIRMWDTASGELRAEFNGGRGIVNALAVDPKTWTIAAGSGLGEITLFDGRTGGFRASFETQTNAIGALAFTPDGNWLVTTASAGTDKFVQVVWDVASGKKSTTYGGHDDVVGALAIDFPRGVVATGGGINHQIHLWNLDSGERIKGPDDQVLNLSGRGATIFSVGFSEDSGTIAWGQISDYRSNNDRGAFEFKLVLPKAAGGLRAPEPVSPDGSSHIRRAITTFKDSSLEHRPGGAYGALDAELIVRNKTGILRSIMRDQHTGYAHVAYSYTPEGDKIVSGGWLGHLAVYDLRKKLEIELPGHVDHIWAATPSPDGRLLVTGSADQTVRLWNMKTYELLCSLFRARDGEWVIWTPQGYYAGSPGADRLIGWQMNQGPGRSAEFVSADQLRKHLYRPDIVERAISMESAIAAVKESGPVSFRLADLASRKVPRFSIVSPDNGDTMREPRMKVKIKIETVKDPVKTIRVAVNERQVIDMAADSTTGSGGYPAGEQELDVPLARGRNVVQISLGNAIGVRTQSLIVGLNGEGDLDKRGVLYVLAIGVDRYVSEKGNLPDLSYAGADATGFEAAARTALQGQHERVISKLLVDSSEIKPTAANITDALDGLKAAKENDTVVLFIAGHGANDGPNYRFLPSDAEMNDTGWRSNKAITWYSIEEVLQAVKGRRILFVDTCHSQNAYNQRLGNVSYHENIVSFSSARWDQFALENPELKHGLFTYAVVEGLLGTGAAKRQDDLRVFALHDYVSQRVQQLAKEIKDNTDEQHPQMFSGRDAVDYVLVPKPASPVTQNDSSRQIQ